MRPPELDGLLVPPGVEILGEDVRQLQAAQGVSAQVHRTGCNRTTGPQGFTSMPSVHMPDVVIVGSGIASGALATGLAASGVRVLTLERQVEYRDHVRGEILWPWGVRLARKVGVEGVLLDA